MRAIVASIVYVTSFAIHCLFTYHTRTLLEVVPVGDIERASDPVQGLLLAMGQLPKAAPRTPTASVHLVLGQ